MTIMGALPTCRIFAFTGTNKLHAKVFVFDRKVTAIGTYNLDPMSEQINSEVVALIRSPNFALRNRKRIERDIEHCIEYRIDRCVAGTIRQVVGPSDHCTTAALAVVRALGSTLFFLRPLM